MITHVFIEIPFRNTKRIIIYNKQKTVEKLSFYTRGTETHII